MEEGMRPRKMFFIAFFSLVSFHLSYSQSDGINLGKLSYVKEEGKWYKTEDKCNQSNPSSFWEQTNGPYEAEITAIAMSPDGDIFCATAFNGLFRSTNYGMNWTNSDSGLSFDYVPTILINEDGNIFVGTESYCIYRSTDNGISWMKINQGFSDPNTPIRTLAIDSSGSLYAGTVIYGVFRSTDNGNNWIQVNNGLDVKDILSIEINTNDDIYAVTSNGVFLSTDNGERWNRTNWGFNTESLTMAPNNNIYVDADSGVYRSTDNGISWEQISKDSINFQFGRMRINTDGYIFSSTSKGLFRSIDGGKSWIEINDGLVSNDIEVLELDAKEILYAGSRTGFYVSSDNGENWTQRNTGLGYARIGRLVVSANNEIYASAAGVCRSTNNGDDWVYFNKGFPIETFAIEFAINSTDDIYAAAYEDVYRLSKAEEKWIPTNLNHFTRSIAINSYDHILAGTSEGIFISTDNGTSWAPTDLTEWINSVSVDRNNNIYAATDDYIFLSTNNGTSWTKTNFVHGSNDYIKCLAINSENTIFAGTLTSIYRSSDMGITWKEVFLSSYFMFSSIVINNEGYIYASTLGKGIYYSTDNGDTWNQINEGLAFLRISSLALSKSGYLYAGTASYEGFSGTGGGVFRSTRSTTSIREHQNHNKNELSSFLLLHNYPNPFNSQTRIKISVPFSAFVDLEIFDINGKKVKTIVQNKLVDRGEYIFNADGKDLSSGIYFCRLTTTDKYLMNKQVKTNKLILLK